MVLTTYDLVEGTQQTTELSFRDEETGVIKLGYKKLELGFEHKAA